MKFKRNSNLKMALQFFADPAPAAAGDPALAGSTPPTGTAPGQTAAIDYGTIQKMLEGTLAAKEDTALKAYFKQQGLSQEEMDQAIGAFKTQKAASQPDVMAIQSQLTQAQALAQQAQIQSAATMAAVSLGIDVKTIPYVIKMADLSQAAGQDGKINDETVVNALKTVLEAVPGLKAQPGQSTGFVQIGAGGQTQSANAVDSELDRIFGIKKK